MSNKRKIRELNGGKLTRPRAQWHGHARNRYGRHVDAAGADAMTGMFARQLAATQNSISVMVGKLLRNRQKTG